MPRNGSFPDGSVGKESCKTGDMGLIPESGRSPGGGNGNPLQDSYLETPMDRGAYWAPIHSVAELDMTEVTYHACTCCLQANHAS